MKPWSRLWKATRDTFGIVTVGPSLSIVVCIVLVYGVLCVPIAITVLSASGTVLAYGCIANWHEN